MKALDDDDVLIRLIPDEYVSRVDFRLNSSVYKSKRNNINASVEVVRLIRQGGHDLYEFVLDQIANSNYNSFVSIKVGEVRKLGFEVKHTPGPDNPYHAEIFPKAGTTKISRGNSNELRRKSIWQMKGTGIPIQ